MVPDYKFTSFNGRELRFHLMAIIIWLFGL